MSADPTDKKLTAEDVRKIFEEKTGLVVKEVFEKFGLPALREASMSKRIATVREDTGDVCLSPDEPRGKALARFMMALALDKGADPAGALKKVKALRDESSSKFERSTMDETIANLEKSLESSTGSAGGVFVPEDLRMELIPLLRATNVVRASGAQVVDMPSGNLSMNFQASASTSTFVDELEPVEPSQPSTGRLKLTMRKQITLVPISNDLFRYAAGGFDTFVRDDMVQTSANREDLAAIRDTGSENTPKGLRFLADPAKVVAVTNPITVASVTNDLADMVQSLEDDNIPMTRPGWLFTPRTKWFLMAQRGADGMHIWRDEMRSGTLFGFPFRTTTQIPNNLGVGADESEIYFVDFAQIVIGEARTMEIDVFDGAAYQDGADIRSGVSRDERVMRAISAWDITDRQRGKSIAVRTEVDWAVL